MKFEEFQNPNEKAEKTKEAPLRSLFNMELVNTARDISEMNGMDALEEIGKITQEDPEKAEKLHVMIGVIKANNPTQSLKSLFNDPEKVKELVESSKEENE